MAFDVIADVNWPAVLLAALAWFALGAMWYIAPPIARRWQRAGGGIEVPEGGGPNPVVFILTLIAYLAAAKPSSGFARWRKAGSS